MELNREQIIKALECISGELIKCKECAYFNNSSIEPYPICRERAANAAISIIKELTEENERLKSVEFTCGFLKPHKVLECPIFDEIARAKADTVRKMQERLKAQKFTHKNFGELVYVEDIDQIAKEILEGV